MDTRKLTDILRATIDPNQRQQAEEQLGQVTINVHGKGMMSNKMNHVAYIDLH